MGTAFVVFRKEQESESKVIHEIGRIVFRSIVEAMERQRPGDEQWKLMLDASYGIKWLYVGADPGSDCEDFGPSFLSAIRFVREFGPPEYYPDRDLDLLAEQLDLLEQTYLSVRGE